MGFTLCLLFWCYFKFK